MAAVSGQARRVSAKVCDRGVLELARLTFVRELTERNQERRITTELILAVDLNGQFRQRRKAVARLRFRSKAVEPALHTLVVRDLVQASEVVLCQVRIPDVECSH